MLNKSWKVIFSALVGLVITSPTSVITRDFNQHDQPTNYCYAIDALGQTIDLTDLCSKARRRANDKKASQKLSDTDKDFIEAYKQELNNFPVVRDNILSKLDRSPITEVNRAKSVCRRKIGASEKQSDRGEDTSALEVLEKLARQFYCAETIGQPRN